MFLLPSKYFYKIETAERIVWIVWFFVSLGIMTFLCLLAADIVNIDGLVGTCGFKERYGLACPGCGITTSCKLFFSGHIVRAFYVQPAGAALCLAIVASWILACITGAFGVQLWIIPPVRIWDGWKIILVMLIIFAFGWAVSLIKTVCTKGYE